MTFIGCIVQARMTSTRLPGKVLKHIKNQMTMLECVIRRLQQSKMLDLIVIATTTNKTDDPIVELCKKLEVETYRGSEHDVLERYYFAAKEFNLEHVVRVTSDCPAIDPQVIDEISQFYLKFDYNYVANILARTFPRGMDVEIFSFQSLKKAHKNAIEPHEREHVTAYIYGHPKQFSLGLYRGNHGNYSKYRLTVDTHEDLEAAQNVFALLPDNLNFSLDDLIEIFKSHPEWSVLDQGKQTKFNSSDYYQENKKK